MKKLLLLILSLFVSIVILGCNNNILIADDEEIDYHSIVGTFDIDEDVNDFYVKESNNDKISDLPSRFNLNELGYVTPVKSQGSFGTCWAHAIMASAESTSIMDGEVDSDIDLSELNVAYYEYSNEGFSDKLGLVKDDYSYCESTGTDLLFDQGGNLSLAVMNLSSGIGFSYESRIPYTNNKYFDRYNKSGFDLEQFENAYVNGHPDDCYNNDFLLVNGEMFSFENRDLIKEKLMTEGAMAVSYYDTSTCLNSQYSAYFITQNTSSNHAVTLVGWDDDFPKERFKKVTYNIDGVITTYSVQNNGAWIIKNSWGTSNLDKGYMYISYEDSSLNAHPAVLFDIEPWDSDKNIYQYDGTIATNRLSYGHHDKHYESNIYKTQRDEFINRVGFYTSETDVDYTVYVYANLTSKSKPMSGTKIAEKSGHQQTVGFHTVDFDLSDYASGQDGLITAGTTFSVVLKISGEDTQWFYCDKTIEMKGSYWYGTYSSYESGQSYYGYESNGNTSWTNISDGNLRVKGYTNSIIADYTEQVGLTIKIADSSFLNKINDVKINDKSLDYVKQTDYIVIPDEQLIINGIEGNVEVNITTSDDKSKSVKANIVHNDIKNTITLDVNGGDSLANNKFEITYARKYGTLPTPTRTGYTFTGWYTDKTAGDKITKDSYVIYIQNNLYAHWEKITHNITYHLSDDVINNQNNPDVYDELGTTTLYDPSRNGYLFDGWYLEDTYQTKITSINPSIYKKDLDLYAKWLIQGTPHLLTVQSTSNASVTGYGNYVSGQQVTVSSTNRIEGYVFDGWFECDIDGNIVNNNPLSTSETYTFPMIDKDLNIKAVYHSNKKYVLSIKGEAFLVNDSQEAAEYMEEFKAQEVVTITYNGDAPFAYWENSSHKIVSTDLAYTLTLSGDTELFAVSKSNSIYRYLFISAYNQILSTSAFNKNKDMTPTVMPLKAGSTFKCWKIRGTQTEYSNDQISDGIKEYVKTNPVDKLLYIDPYYDAIEGQSTLIIEYVDENNNSISSNTLNAYTTMGGVYLEAPSSIGGKSFSYWEFDGEIVSYLTTCRYYTIPGKQATIKAVYGLNVKPIPVVTIGEKFADSETESITYVFNRAVPDNYEILAFGAVYTFDEDNASEDKLTLEAGASHINGTSITNVGNYNLMANEKANHDRIVYARGFVTYIDSYGVEDTIYTSIVSESYTSLNN